MKTIAWAVMVVIGISVGVRAAEPSDIEAIRAELKPLRKQAYKETDVKAAKEKLDAAYREYWTSVKAAMLRLAPEKAGLIEKDIKSRESSDPISKTSPLRD